MFSALYRILLTRTLYTLFCRVSSHDQEFVLCDFHSYCYLLGRVLPVSHLFHPAQIPYPRVSAYQPDFIMLLFITETCSDFKDSHHRNEVFFRSDQAFLIQPGASAYPCRGHLSVIQKAGSLDDARPAHSFALTDRDLIPALAKGDQPMPHQISG